MVLVTICAFLCIAFVYWYVKDAKKRRIRNALLAAGTADPSCLTPVQYELFCAALLENNGWSTQKTRVTGDFGADVIAKKGSRILIIQCKQWTGNVGVKAVQEVYTALTHYNGTDAIVVTTSGYTSAAVALSQTTGVKLMKHTDLIGII